MDSIAVEIIKASPGMAIAVLAILINYKLVVRWANDVETRYAKISEAMDENTKALHEIVENLKRMNGKK